jgi:hypothetical protein
MDKPPKFEQGTISPNVSVASVTIRVMSDSGDPHQELRLQGRIKNNCPFPLDEVKCDLSYWDQANRFLGLDATNFAELDEIDPGETAPFDVKLTVPIDAERCVFNVHSKRVLQDIGVALKEYVSSQKPDSPGRISEE